MTLWKRVILLARNKYDIDETLDTPFSFKHLERSFVYIKKHAKKMIFAISLSMIAVLCGLIGPYIMKIAVDNAVPTKDIKQLIFLSLILIATIVISVVLTCIRAVLVAQIGQDIIYEIRQDLFEKLQKLPFSYYDSRPHGKILVRVIQYVNSVSDLLSNGIINFVLQLFSLVFIVVFMFLVNVKMSFVILAGLPLFIAIMFIIKPVQRKSWQRVSSKSSNLNAYLHESISGVKITQIFVREDINKGIYVKLCEAFRASWLRAIYVSNLVWFSVENISQMVFGFIYIVGVYWSIAAISFGTVLAMGSYAQRFWQPINDLSNLYNGFMNTIAYLERIFETIDEPVDIVDVDGAISLPQIEGNVEFNDVMFEYDPGVKVLNDINFKVKAGESIALVGPTGAGKSTIVNLISRFYNLTSGSVLIDGNNISQVTLSSLRMQMGIMLQDSFIFSGTLIDNIRYGRLNATDEEVIKAAKTVHADEFISQMQHGYSEEVNERGSRLSQGQKQLISFARTLLADPKILILDEATSSIDTNTEQLLQKGLDELLKGRTSFIIAHRLSTIRHCDRIMYIDKGRITETGSHDELIAKKGTYYSLYMSQLTN
jgi:ATP-binding cassette subfamily B multidrug efflux pump